MKLNRSPIPEGKTIFELKKDARFCYTCFNLYGGCVNAIVPLGRTWMEVGSAQDTATRAAQLGKISKSSWAQSIKEEYATWRIEAELTDMAQSAASGCKSCLLLTKILTRLNPQVFNFNDPALRLDIIFCKGSAMILTLDRVEDPTMDMDFWVPRQDPSEEINEYELYVLPGSTCPWPTIGSFLDRVWPGENSFRWTGGQARHISVDPYSPRLLNTIQNWIRDCQESHSICANSSSLLKRRLPKRVVRIDPNNAANISLLETEDSPDEPYIALSHCWGKTENLLLTKATVDFWKEKIPFEKLSNTFRDTVRLTHGLQIEYLWIDSLCIIQDDKMDWEIEAAKMASIYEGAHLVLSVTGYPDGETGFLNPRQPYTTLSGSFPSGEPYEIHARESIDHKCFSWGMGGGLSIDFINHTNLSSMVDVERYPLLYRAWCFQERVLATRILHFTKEEAVFDCLTGMNCECGTLRNHQKDGLMPHRRILRTGYKHNLQQPEDKDRFQLPQHNRRWSVATENEFTLHHEVWRDLVSSYSSKRITRKTDGLPAIGGLAAKMSNKLTGRYLAGLWERDLLAGLRWYPVEKEEGEPVSEYTAPSWSWVSVHRGVSWGVESFENNEYFVRADPAKTCCPASGQNPFGEVSCGYIFVTGRIMTIQISHLGAGRKPKLRKRGIGEAGFDFQPDRSSELELLDLSEVICLRLCTKSITRNAWDDDCALVLRKPDSRLLSKQPLHVREWKHVYQRVGYFEVYASKAWRHEHDSQEVGLYLI